jgi:hypothetical protein
VTDTLIFDAYTALLAIVTAAVPDFVVYDGPQPVLPTDLRMALVGCSDALGGGPQRSADQGVQEWESLGASSRMETFTINSTLIVWTGNNDLPGCRATLKTAVNAIGAALRPPPHGTGDGMLGNVLNQNGSGTGWCGFAVGDMTQIQLAPGPAVQVQFSVLCTARI